MNKIIIITGFSASGKDTLARNLEKEGCHFIVSHTTRPMRPGEFQGNPYWFIKKEDFLAMAEKGEFIEHRQYNTLVNNVPDIWHYGVFKESVCDDKTNVVVLDLLGAMEFKKYFGDRCITFFLGVDVETRRQRCIKRGDYNEFEFDRRNKDDEEKFTHEMIEAVTDHTINSWDEDYTLATALDYLAVDTGIKEYVVRHVWDPKSQNWVNQDKEDKMIEEVKLRYDSIDPDKAGLYKLKKGDKPNPYYLVHCRTYGWMMAMYLVKEGVANWYKDYSAMIVDHVDCWIELPKLEERS